MRGLWTAATAFLLLTPLLAAGALLSPAAPMWLSAQQMALLIGVLLLGLEALSLTTLKRFRPAQWNGAKVPLLTALYTAGATLLVLGRLLQPSLVFQLVGTLGMILLLAGSIVSIKIHFAVLPGRKESVVDVERDPLTKGDDASWKHLRFAHMFLPLGLLFMLATWFPLPLSDGGRGIGIAAAHLVGLGYGVLSLYGLGHIWVPRFSGVPAIAAGAIKGELHSTLPAMIFLPVGFITGLKGFIIAGGAFAFLGFFTYMGVLGANIMRNKSPTHRVTPEFVYIPWTFSGIFWLVSGVVLGIFLNAVPDMFAGIEGGLRAIHVQVNLVGGVVQLVMGWLTRIVPGDATPPRFQGAMSLSFYAFNGAVVASLWVLVSPSMALQWTAIGLLLGSLALFAWPMQAFIRRPRSGHDS